MIFYIFVIVNNIIKDLTSLLVSTLFKAFIVRTIWKIIKLLVLQTFR